MDMTWITDQIAVGGGIWNDAKMIQIFRAGITHIINMQIEFDDRPLAEPYAVSVLWNPVEDDFLPKPPEVLEKGVNFALAAIRDPGAKVFIHCAAGVHRAPMMALAILRATGWKLEDAMDTIQSLRPVVDFAPVYVKSVEDYVRKSATVSQRTKL
jgi:protein-tyrosine phosphatase